jgi:hypothetical protein
MFRCDDEAKWIEKRKQQADLRQKQRRETQAAKSQSELDKQRAIEQEQQQIQRQIQQAAAQQAVMPMAMSRPPPDLLHQMRVRFNGTILLLITFRCLECHQIRCLEIQQCLHFHPS